MDKINYYILLQTNKNAKSEKKNDILYIYFTHTKLKNTTVYIPYRGRQTNNTL